jgi:hypothetical protein
VNAPLAARGANQRLTKTSTLASFAFRRPLSVEKISSIKDSASAVLQNVRKLKMLNVLTASNSSNPESSMFLSALEAPGKGASELFQRASSAPAQLSSPGAGPRWDLSKASSVEEIAMMQPDDALAPPPKEAGALRVQIRVKQHAPLTPALRLDTHR